MRKYRLIGSGRPRIPSDFQRCYLRNRLKNLNLLEFDPIEISYTLATSLLGYRIFLLGQPLVFQMCVLDSIHSSAPLAGYL